MTIDVECPEHGTVPIEMPGILIGTDRAGLFAAFVCPRCSIAAGRRIATYWTITPTIASTLVEAGARDLRHIGLAIRAQLADRQAVPPRPASVDGGPPQHRNEPCSVLPHQAAASARPVELDDPARRSPVTLTEDEAIEFGRLLEPLTYPAAFAARQMRGAAS